MPGEDVPAGPGGWNGVAFRIQLLLLMEGGQVGEDILAQVMGRVCLLHQAPRLVGGGSGGSHSGKGSRED